MLRRLVCLVLGHDIRPWFQFSTVESTPVPIWRCRRCFKHMGARFPH